MLTELSLCIPEAPPGSPQHGQTSMTETSKRQPDEENHVTAHARNNLVRILVLAYLLMCSERSAARRGDGQMGGGRFCVALFASHWRPQRIGTRSRAKVCRVGLKD